MKFEVISLLFYFLGINITKCLLRKSSHLKEPSYFHTQDNVYILFEGFPQNKIEETLSSLRNGSLNHILDRINQIADEHDAIKLLYELREKNNKKKKNFLRRSPLNLDDISTISSSSSSSSEDSSSNSTDSSDFNENKSSDWSDPESYASIIPSILRLPNITNIQPYADPNNLQNRPALRFGSSCSKGASKACNKACGNVLKNVCQEYRCPRGMKNVFRKECKRNCKSRFD